MNNDNHRILRNSLNILYISIPILKGRFNNIKINVSYLSGIKKILKYYMKDTYTFSKCSLTPFIETVKDIKLLYQYRSELFEYAAIMALLMQGYKPLDGHRSFVIKDSNNMLYNKPYSDEIDFIGYRGNEVIVLEVKTSINYLKIDQLIDQMKKRIEMLNIKLTNKGIKSDSIKAIITYCNMSKNNIELLNTAKDDVIEFVPLPKLIEPLCKKSILITKRLCNEIKRCRA